MPRLLAILPLLALYACSSTEPSGTAYEEFSHHEYQHSKAYLMTIAEEMLTDIYGTVEEPEEAEALPFRVQTPWKVRLSPHSDQGTRERMVVSIEGEDGAARFRVAHEVEKNTEKVFTLDLVAAKWVAADASGAPAHQFLQLLEFREDLERTKVAPKEGSRPDEPTDGRLPRPN